MRSPRSWLLLFGAGTLMLGCSRTVPPRDLDDCLHADPRRGEIDPSILRQQIPPDSQLVEFVYRSWFAWQYEDFPDPTQRQVVLRDQSEANTREWLRENLAPIQAIRDSSEIWWFFAGSNDWQGTEGVVALHRCRAVEWVDLIIVG